MAKFLVIFSDVLDEVDVNGFEVMSDKDFESYEELAQSITWNISYYINDDKKISFENGEDLLNRVECKEISNEQYKNLKALFNSGFGVFITEEYLESLVEDNEDKEEDDDSDGYNPYDED